jgi:ubiquinone/menaquinone biosynthesis C-methylase UbiE
MDSKKHWETIYTTKEPTKVSWHQPYPELSLEIIKRTGVGKEQQIIDVGASTLVDDLLAGGYRNVTVLDISGAALALARERLGRSASRVTWVEADITRIELPSSFYDLWHDRAVFHFLTSAEDRERYVEAVRRSVKNGGHVIVATFGLEGPLSCSGLTVSRYSAESLHQQFGGDFELVDSMKEIHQTPGGTEQSFVYCYCRRE